jgi:hypothetical protein
MSKAKKFIIVIAGFIILSTVVSLSIFAYFFSDILLEEYAAIEIKQLPQKNPTSYVFNGNLEEVRQKIISGTKYPDYESPFPFKDYDDLDNDSYKSNVGFYICEAKDEICLSTNEKTVKEIFNKEENRNDIYLANDGRRTSSSVYYAAGKSLEFRTDFHIHLEANEDNKVKVTIFPVNPLIYKGYGGIGLHGAILKKEIPVVPTTVEEYQLLRYIGFVLEEKDMPEVILPE